MGFNKIKLFGSMLFCITALWSAGLSQQTKKDYLENNSEIISMDGNDKFAMFDQGFYANQLFLLGEMHGTSASYQFQKLLVEKLKERTNFRIYVLELDHISAQNFNTYLKTGNEELRNIEFESMKGSFGYSREYREIFTNIRRINQTLKSEDRIRFIGVDKFSGTNGNFRYLSGLLRESNYKKGSNSELDEILASVNSNLTGARRFEIIKYLSAELQKDEQKYRKMIGGRFWEYKLIVENFSAALEIDKVRDVRPLSSQETDDVRDARMASNFTSIVKDLKLGKEKMFGFFGREHIYQEAGKRTDWMTARIKKACPDMRIVSIALRYMDSDFMIPTYFLELQFGKKQEKLFFYGGFQNDNSPFVRAVGIEELNLIKPESDVVLFRLSGQDSPYDKLPDLVDEIADGKSTTDYFGYAVLLRKSKAATPISDN